MMRRLMIGLLPALALLILAAGPVIAPAPVVNLPVATITPDIDIDAGQSWQSLSWPSFGLFGLNQQQQTLLALQVPSIGSPTFKPGPLPASAGISLPGTPNGITGYSATDDIAIGRASILAEQLYRKYQLGSTSLTPILHYAAAYPGSSWTTGGGGGLAPGASFTASIANDTMTVTAVASGTLVVGQHIKAAGVTGGTGAISTSGDTIITAFGSGAGGTGSYTVGVAQTVVSETLTIGGVTYTGSIGGGGPSNIMTITAVTGGGAGAIAVGQTVTGTSVLSGTKVATAPQTGIGTYTLEVGNPQNVASETMQALGVSWANMLTVEAAISNIFPLTNFTANYLLPCHRAINWTQGGGLSVAGSTTSDWTAMEAAFDGLNLHTCGRQLQFFMGIRAGLSTDTDLTTYPQYGEIYNFVRANANGRTWGTTPWYQWPFAGPGDAGYANIHTGPYGSIRHGEFEGYAKAVFYDEGLGRFTPLWRSLTQPITVSGQTITIPFDRPSGSGFTSSALQFYADATDGLSLAKANPAGPVDYGFAIKRGGAFLTLTASPTIVGLNVVETVAEALNHGDVLEVSYAMHGPGGTNPGLQSGVWGNLMMAGPPSYLFPGKAINAWAWQFAETVTVP